MTPTHLKTWLRWLLFVIGGGLSLATFAIFLPVDLMASIHDRLGLDEFPDRPIVIYLARSTSMLYAVHGLVILWVAIHFERYWDFVPVIGGLHAAMGVIILYVDINAGMPWYWTAAEGGPIAAAGCLIVWMWQKANVTDDDDSRCPVRHEKGTNSTSQTVRETDST